jgi:hypothetical protein
MNALATALEKAGADAEIIETSAALYISSVMIANTKDETAGVQFAGVSFHKFREAFCVGRGKVANAMDVLNAMRDAEEIAR